MLTLVNPQELAQRHLDAGRDLGALKVEIRQVRNLNLEASSSPTELSEMTAPSAL
ncbi:hypothetical protein [Nocardia gipuzkoensis]